MDGDSIGSLHAFVNAVRTSTIPPKTQIWSLSGPQGAQWKKQRIFIGSRTNFELTIAAHRGIDCKQLPQPKLKCDV